MILFEAFGSSSKSPYTSGFQSVEQSPYTSGFQSVEHTPLGGRWIFWESYIAKFNWL
jgi:hypothetical protein